MRAPNLAALRARLLADPEYLDEAIIYDNPEPSLLAAPNECGICAAKLQHLRDVAEDGRDISFTLCPDCGAREWVMWRPKKPALTP